jgi:hypothetical protein
MPIDTSGFSGTLTATRTLISQLELASASNVNSAASVATRYATATRPATGAGSIVVAPSFNYIKFQTLNATSGHTLIAYVIGWTFVSGAALWVPSLLTKVTVTGAVAGSITIPPSTGTALFPGLTYVKNLGDAKVYNGETGSVVNGFVIVDTAGCELVELHVVTAAGASATNALINFI